MPYLGIHAEYESSDVAGKYITHIPLRRKTFELVRSWNFVAYADHESRGVCAHQSNRGLQKLSDCIIVNLSPLDCRGGEMLL